MQSLAGSGVKEFKDGQGSEACFHFPTGIVVDGEGNFILADTENHRIRKVTPQGMVFSLAGSGEAAFRDGEGSKASFCGPSGVAVDIQGNVFVADSGNHRIRVISPQGLVSTFAGSGEQGFKDGRCNVATFYEPNGICLDHRGNLYVADTFNHKIRMITPCGLVSTLAGSGEAEYREGVGAEACFNWPRGVAVDVEGSVIVADTGNHRIRKITPQGVVVTLAGNGEGDFKDGQGTEACFMQPYGVAVDGQGQILVADTDNNCIRNIDTQGTVSTLVGRGGLSCEEGKYPPLTVEEEAGNLSGPVGLVVDTRGSIIVADTANHRICKLPQHGCNVALRFGGINILRSDPCPSFDIHAMCLSYLHTLRTGAMHDAKSILTTIKKAVLTQGLSNQSKKNDSSSYTTRGLVWKILLEIFFVDVKMYITTLTQGTCEKYGKIRDDTFRTFQTSIEFQSAVNEKELIRVLNAHVLSRSPQRYVQGLNLMCGPILYCMSELDTFFTFDTLINKTYFYWKSNYIGAQAGCVLVDRVLAELDTELAEHLLNKGLSAFVYAFPCVSSFSAAVRPFNELLHLWDFLLVCGLHFNVMCVAAQVLLLRNQLLAVDKPKQILDYRVWPPLQAKVVIDLVKSVTPLVSPLLWDDVVEHIHNREVVKRLTGRTPD